MALNILHYGGTVRPYLSANQATVLREPLTAFSTGTRSLGPNSEECEVADYVIPDDALQSDRAFEGVQNLLHVASTMLAFYCSSLNVFSTEPTHFYCSRWGHGAHLTPCLKPLIGDLLMNIANHMPIRLCARAP